MFRTMKRHAIVLLIVCLMTSGWQLAYAMDNTTDRTGHWAETQLSAWLQKGFIQGYEDGSLRPNQSVKRGELVALINRTQGLTESADIRFADLGKEHWSYVDVAKAVKAGYIEGYEDNSIRVETNVSRQELAVMLARLLKLGASESAKAVTKFKDGASIADWSRSAIGALAAKGIIDGYEDGSFRPAVMVTRAEAVVMLDRAMSAAIYHKAGVFGPQNGTETIKGNVVVTAPGVTLRNMSIAGDLQLAEGIGEGDVTLQNVTVAGKTQINGGGANSVHIEGSVLAQVIVDKKNGLVRIAAGGTTSIKEVLVLSGVIIETGDVTGTGIDTVTVSESLPKETKITLAGSFGNVQLLASGLLVEVPKGTIAKLSVGSNAKDTKLVFGKESSILMLVLNAVTSVFGQGDIKHAVINAIGIVFEKAPGKIENGSGTGSSAGAGGTSSTATDNGEDSTADPGNGGGNPPIDPGNGGNPPTDPGNGGNPPTDPGNGGNPPTDPGNGGNPPTDPGNGGNPGQVTVPLASLPLGGTVTESVYVGGQRIATVGDSVYATLDQAGTIYLVPGATSRYLTLLDYVVEQGKGIRKQVNAGEKAILSTAGLVPGDYIVVGVNGSYALSAYSGDQELRLNAPASTPLAQNSLYVYSNSKMIDIGFNKPIQNGFATMEALKATVSYATYGGTVTSGTYAINDTLEIRDNVLRITFANAPVGPAKIELPVNALKDSNGAPLAAKTAVEFDFGPSLTVRKETNGSNVTVVTDRAAEVYLYHRGASLTKADLERAVTVGSARKIQTAANTEAAMSTVGLPAGNYLIVAWGGSSASVIIP
ncbi:S-layer homology domain-containing protein [Paenibacillus ginsengarvi]|uniref:SLH domain-containing protein n=1 Tax=Paenibacillus ginsengarvi TaxID=400777 RepID=A0A3B0BGH3_9BACL|nr:S-layer homology domain-containing protein [Paenibacillus ginsengarvi]RKN72465.1 hypothetical protein D7M11_28730 [Paenibacillus ginsengarvi]